MHFTRSSLSCQTVFRVVSDWLCSFSVILCCDKNTKVFVLVKLFSAKSEGFVFFFANQELLQHRVHELGLLPKDSHTTSHLHWKTSQQ